MTARVDAGDGRRFSADEVLALLDHIDESTETIRAMQTVMREVGSDLAENFVGEDAEERYGIREHGKRLIRAAERPLSSTNII